MSMTTLTRLQSRLRLADADTQTVKSSSRIEWPEAVRKASTSAAKAALNARVLGAIADGGAVGQQALDPFAGHPAKAVRLDLRPRIRRRALGLADPPHPGHRPHPPGPVTSPTAA
jgi:hypothetical protein